MTTGSSVYPIKAWWSTALFPGLTSTAAISSGFREARWNDKDLILVLHVARWVNGSGMLNEVGLANLTAFGEIGQTGIVGGITFGILAAQALINAFWSSVKNRSPRSEL